MSEASFDINEILQRTVTESAVDLESQIGEESKAGDLDGSLLGDIMDDS